MIGKIKNYFKESISELRKVNWLTKNETIQMTIEVIMFSLFFAAAYGLVDFLLIKGIFALNFIKS
ncbi:MAG: preprotein translocase subunit SecE [Patescibacteria group bacterium]|nr:preprotein translocase subunit SecE [Patescibacteria group bacterium]MCL5257795.1 preprotein translocase subunit SecE [Patescibacteria group bacterium]